MFEDDEDIEDYFDEEQDRQAAIERYEDMLKSHDAAYFDSAEFEYIIDNYVEKNQLRRSREAGCFGVPANTTRPPVRPALGPTSTT